MSDSSVTIALLELGKLSHFIGANPMHVCPIHHTTTVVVGVVVARLSS